MPDVGEELDAMLGKKGVEFLEGAGRVTDRPEGPPGFANRRSRVSPVLDWIPPP